MEQKYYVITFREQLVGIHVHDYFAELVCDILMGSSEHPECYKIEQCDSLLDISKKFESESDPNLEQ